MASKASGKLERAQHEHVLKRLRRGNDPAEVAAWLVGRGFGPEQAANLVERLDDRVAGGVIIMARSQSR